MKEFSDKVAVITGGASGIGKAFARKALHLGCRVVLADIEAAALRNTASELREENPDVLAIHADVSQSEDVRKLAEATVAEYGGVHLLFNNAGVGMVGPRIWECTVEDWEWILGVNLWGVIHGLDAFLPIMISQIEDSHIINTASASGLLSPPGFAPYNASKHAMVTISETLHHELSKEHKRIKVSVFCPGLVNTGMVDASRNRPSTLVNAPALEDKRSAAYARTQEAMQASTQQAMAPSKAAEIVFNGIRDDEFYIFSHAWVREAVRARMEDIVNQKPPTNPAG